MTDITDSDTATFTDVAVSTALSSADTGSFSESSSQGPIYELIRLLAPIGGALVMTPAPVFTFVIRTLVAGVTTQNMELQVSSTSDFSSDVQTISFATTYLDGATPTSAAWDPAHPLNTAPTYYWRVRRLANAVLSTPGDWTAPASFAPDTAGWQSVNGAVDVVAGAETPPVVWAVAPSRGQGSAAFHVYGSGFGATQGTSQVLIGGVVCPVTTWETVSASANAYTAARVVDELAHIFDPEHGHIVATVPADMSPAATSLTVVRGIPAAPPDFRSPTVWYQGDDLSNPPGYPGDPWPSHENHGPDLINNGADSLEYIGAHKAADLGWYKYSTSVDCNGELHVFAVLRHGSAVVTGGGGSWLQLNSSDNRKTYELGNNLAPDEITIYAAQFDSGYAAIFTDKYHYALPSGDRDHLILVEFMSNGMRLWVNNTEVTSSLTPDSGNTGTPAPLSFTAAQILNSYYTPVFLAELVMFTGVLSSTDRNNCVAYLQGRYGL